MSGTRLLVVGVVAFSCVVSVNAQPTPLALVPAQAPIVVHVRGWERVIGRLQALVKAAAPDYAMQLTNQIESGIGSALMGRELKGLAKDGPLFLVFTEMPTGDEPDLPEMALVAKVANYVEFRDAFLKDEEKKDLFAKDGYETTTVENRAVYFINKGDYIVMTASEKARKLFQDKKTESLAGKLTKSMESKLLESDVSAYVDVKAINEKFGKDLANAKMEMEQELKRAEDMGGVMKSQLQLVQRIMNQVFQAIADGEQFVAALSFPIEGFALSLQGRVGEKTKTNELLAAAKSASIDGLGKLPSGSMMYSTGTVGQDWMKSMNGFFLLSSLGRGQAGGNVPDDKAVEEAAAELTALQVADWSMSYGAASGNLSIMRYREPQKAMAANRKLFAALAKNGTFAGLPIKGKPEIKHDAEKIGAFTFDATHIAWDFDKFAEQFPEPQREMMKEVFQKLLGLEQRTWTGTDGKTFVEITAKDWNSAKKDLEAYFSGKSALASEAGFADVRKHLPAEVAMVGIIDSARYAHLIAQFFAVGFNANGGGIMVEPKPPQGPPHFIGVAAGMKPRELTVNLWVPASGIKAIVAVIKPIIEALDR